jgi:hypothetical protein
MMLSVRFGGLAAMFSGQAARELRERYPPLFAMVRDGLIAAPPKDPTGRYLWTAEDVERGRRMLESRRQHVLPIVAD